MSRLSETSDEDAPEPEVRFVEKKKRFKHDGGGLSQSGGSRSSKKRKHYSSEQSDDEEESASQMLKSHKKHFASEQSDDDEDRSGQLFKNAKHFSSEQSDDDESFSREKPKAKPSKYNRDDTLQRPVDGYGFGSKLMKKFGYVEGEGLGINKQGRVEPVGLSTQQGRKGLGFQAISQGKPYDGPGWDPAKEVVIIEETPIWTDVSPLEQMDLEDLENGMVVDGKKDTIHDETKFCDPKILENILSLKTLFDKIPKEKLRTLVSRCNLYETIEKVFFINRAALKMANMDAVFDFMFTSPKLENGEPMVNSNWDLLYFADVCAGPGGFSEYVLWKKKWKAKGFGFTLRGDNDFKLSNMLAGPIDSFFPYYGVKDDGDIFNPANLRSLKEHIMQQTDNKGVHFLMGDGGFSVEGEENIQEIRSKQLYLCQCIAALSLVRTNGHFVVKLFDTFTEFSVGLIYLMYRSFKFISIHKPVTSRPANSERYLICKWKRSNCDTIERYLIGVNELMWKFTHDRNQQNKDVMKLVSYDTIVEDSKFYKYIYDSNNRIGEGQILSLLKINEAHIDPSLLDTLMYDGNFSHEEKKIQTRKKLLELWEIPDEKRRTPKKPHYNELLRILLEKMNAHDNCVNDEHLKNVLSHQCKLVTNKNDLATVDPQDPKKTEKELIKSIYDWYFVYCNSVKTSNFTFYLGLGGLSVCKLVGRSWVPFSGISLPEGTLIYAEDVEEMRGEGRGIHKSHSLHILDAFTLGNEPVFHFCLKWRQQFIKLFCSALSIPPPNKSEHITYPLRPKDVSDLYKLPQELNKLIERTLKNSQSATTTNVENTDLYYVVNALQFFKFTRDTWMTFFSKTYNHLYYVEMSTKRKCYEVKVGSFNHTFDNLLTTFRCQLRDGNRYTSGFEAILGKIYNLP